MRILLHLMHRNPTEDLYALMQTLRTFRYDDNISQWQFICQTSNKEISKMKFHGLRLRTHKNAHLNITRIGVVPHVLYSRNFPLPFFYRLLLQNLELSRQTCSWVIRLHCLTTYIGPLSYPKCFCFQFFFFCFDCFEKLPSTAVWVIWKPIHCSILSILPAVHRSVLSVFPKRASPRARRPVSTLAIVMLAGRLQQCWSLLNESLCSIGCALTKATQRSPLLRAHANIL